MDLGLQGKIAVITGGSKGIGYATANCFLSEGAKVALCARGEEELEAAARALAERYGADRVFCRPVDVTDPVQVDAFAAQVADRFGGLSIWVNNVGASRKRAGEDYTPEEIDFHTRICFSSTVYGTQAAARYMKQGGGGAIVNLSSLAARCGTAGRSTLYGPLKAAVVGLATTFAAELAAWHIRVNAVLPGFTVTPAVEATIPPEELEVNRMRTLLHRAADPEEIAKPIVFLASDAASYITGASLEVSGGNTVVLNTGYSYEERAKQAQGNPGTSL